MRRLPRAPAQPVPDAGVERFHMDPGHQEVMPAAGLRPGERAGTDLYPEVWSNPIPAAQV